MKKILKLGLTCIIILLTVAFFSNRIYAAESSDNVLNIEDWLKNIEESDVQAQTNNDTTQDNTNNSSPIDIPDVPEEPDTTPEPTPTPQTNPEPEPIKEEKLPQTGEAENYILIVAAFAFGGIAIYAYRKNKKYNI